MKSGALGRLYRDGEVLVREGEVGDCMYVLQEGEADVLVERETRCATVRARGDVRALTVDRKTFLERVHQDPSLAFRVAQALSKRIRELSDEVARLKARQT